MQLFIIQQREFFDFRTPDAVNAILIRAETEEAARRLATESEMENRDGVQLWDVEHSSCAALQVDGEPKVILTA